MAIETQLLGETAAKCMDYLESHEALDEGQILGVGIVVVAQTADGETSFTRTFCSETTFYKQVGLFDAAQDCVRQGWRHERP